MTTFGGFVLATSRAWHEPMAARLAARTGRPFHLVTRKEELTAERLGALGAEMVFLPHWSFIVPRAVHDAFECVIFHMTDVPYGRGGSPLQNLIVRGHTMTKLTALRCVAELDAGPVYGKRELDLSGPAHEIFARASALTEEMIVDIVTRRPTPVAQTGEPVVWKRREPGDGDLRLAKDLRQIYDLIRMLDADGYPHAFLDVGALRAEFVDAAFDEDGVTAKVRFVRREGPQ